MESNILFFFDSFLFVVVASSMGGTDENNFLNSIGKAKDGSGDGDILVWKRKVSAKVLSKRSNKRTYVVDYMSLNSDSHRQAYFDFESFPFIDIKAEKYLLKSGLDYTIIHPGGLIDTPASQQQLVLDVDDKLLKNEKRSISRADVANLCVAALEVGKDGQSVSLDCIATDVEEGTEIKSATAALEEFLSKEMTCDYSL